MANDDVLTSEFGPQLVQGPGADGSPPGPELVQLLTPEGERVEHPSFSFDLDDPNACCMSIATMGVDGTAFTEIVPLNAAEQTASGVGVE